MGTRSLAGVEQGRLGVVGREIALPRPPPSECLIYPRGVWYNGLGVVNILEAEPMAHTIRDKKKLLNRVRRIRGQIDAVEKALEQEQDCTTILMTIAACRGAINGLMAEVIEGHIRFHVVDPDHQPTSDTARAAQELIDVVKAYLR
jgi:DNA-binding FrmR family transcriptional regulator